MTRLTKSIKEDIISVVEARCITDKAEALKERITDFCKRIFWNQISKDDYQIWRTLPPCLTNDYRGLHITIHDDSLGQLCSSYLAASYPRFMSNWIYYEKLSQEDRNEFKALMREQNDHDAYVKQVKDNLNSVLNSVTTVKKLREVWVNGADVIDKALGMSQQSPTTYMPMIAISQLDALVPLP